MFILATGQRTKGDDVITAMNTTAVREPSQLPLTDWEEQETFPPTIPQSRSRTNKIIKAYGHVIVLTNII